MASIFHVTLLFLAGIIAINAQDTTTASSGDCFSQCMERASEPYGGNLMARARTASARPSYNESDWALPPITTAQFELACAGSRAFRTCLETCNVVEEAETKAKLLRLSDGIAALTCDADIKQNYGCLAEKSRIPAPECDEQCRPFLTSIGQLDDDDTDFTASPQLAKLMCQLLNCRLKCRKSSIVAGCGQPGFDAAKKILTKGASLTLIVTLDFLDMFTVGPMPDECKVEGLLRDL